MKIPKKCLISKVFCYEIFKEYDERSRLIKEINPVGEATHYEWDNSNNKIEEKKPEKSSNMTTTKANQTHPLKKRATTTEKSFKPIMATIP